MSLRLFLALLCSNLHSVYSQHYLENNNIGDINENQQIINQISDITKELLYDITVFWLTYGPDKEFGGFHGSLDWKGQPTSQTEKTVIQQSRHLFAFSFLFYNLNNGLQFNENNTFSIDYLEEQMEELFQFFVDSFVSDEYPEFPHMISRDGNSVLDSDVRMYYTCFGIFGLSWYAKATKNNANRNLAVQVALRAFRSMDGRLHDWEFLGYDQTRENNWFQKNDYNAAKGLNSHLHLLEALIPFCEVSQDEIAKSRLVEMIFIFMEYIIGDKNYCAATYTKQWTPTSGLFVEYGHDLEGMALLIQAVNAVQSQYSMEEVISKVIPVIQHSVDYGYDTNYGGFFYRGRANQYVDDTSKVFWTQTEACWSLYTAYQLSGKQHYLQKILSTLNFVKQKQQSEVGELYSTVDNDGNIIGTYNLADQFKASYHNMRPLVTILQSIAVS